MIWRRLSPRHSPGIWMTALLLLWGTCSIVWGERLLRNDGFGWDGLCYLRITKGLWQPNPLIWPYSGHRCLPSVVVHYTLKALQFPLDGPYILNAFAIYNMLLLVASLWMLLDACTALKIGPGGRWAMFVGVFCNYVHLKQHYYSACVTDVWAFASAVALLWCYLRRRGWGVWLAMGVGAFTWPVMIHFGAPLFLFPSLAPPGGPLLTQEERPRPSWTGVILAALAALAVGVYTGWIMWGDKFYGKLPQMLMPSLLPLSLVGLSVFVFLALRPLLDVTSFRYWRSYVSVSQVGRFLALGCLVVLIKLAYRQLDTVFVRPGPGPFADDPIFFLRCVLTSGVTKPLVFLVAHVIWYGPVVLGACFCWNRVCSKAKSLGLGVVLTMICAVPMLLNPESRQSLTVFPIYALLVALVIDGERWQRVRWITFVGLALALSKCWLPLNRTPWPEQDLVFDYPIQLFLMSFGGVMTARSYAIQGAAVLLAGGVMMGIMRFRRQTQSPLELPQRKAA